MRTTNTRRRAARQIAFRGMTLIELLVVVTIIVVLMAMAVPLMRPAISQGYIREGSRQINEYLAGARARAAQMEREVGIRFQRTLPGANSAVDVFIVEAPSPYSGDLFEAQARFVDPGLAFNGRIRMARFPDGGSTSLPSLVNVGDFIRFNFKGPFYQITAVSPVGSSPIQVTFIPTQASRDMGLDGKGGQPNFDDDNDGVFDEADEANPFASGSDDGPTPSKEGLTPLLLPPLNTPEGTLSVNDDLNYGIPYQIFRRPVKSSVKALQLAGGTCVDLGYSGFGAAGIQFAAANANDGTPVEIIFNPDGSVSRVSYGGSTGTPPSGTVHILLGRFENIGAAAQKTNVADSNAVWVSVGDRAGTITSAEIDALAPDVATSRIFARSAQSVGGR